MTTQEKLHPGEGYRLLAVGETYRKGDETKFGPRWHDDGTCRGEAREEGDQPVRRKVRPAPTLGRRWVDAGETRTAEWRRELSGLLAIHAHSIGGVQQVDGGYGLSCYSAPYPEDPRLAPKAPAPEAPMTGNLPPTDPRRAGAMLGPIDGGGEIVEQRTTESAEDRYQRRLDAMLAGMRGVILSPPMQYRASGGYETRTTALHGVRDLYRPRAEVGCDDGSGDDVCAPACGTMAYLTRGQR